MDFPSNSEDLSPLPLPIVINGALGKMGIEIAAIVLADRDMRLCGVLERPDHPQQGNDYGMCIGKGALGVNVTDSLDMVDAGEYVIIDFSSAQSTRSLVQIAAAKKAKMVIGTTGLIDSDYTLIKKTSEQIALLASPNMSLGVNLLFSLTELVSSRLKNDFDIEIIEAHHRFKKDAPSGTARRLGEIVAQAYELPYEQAIRNGRSGMATGDRPRSEVGMHAIRGGDIVGDHTVLFAGIGERIELRHMAHSRSTLARGAVAATKWIAQQKPGLYSMRDVLGF
jgi:4-hydroxy-tetrahydrodipicolinate reductase